jgi:type VI secretion system secreted protein VgrG
MRDDLELKQDKRIALLKTPLGEDVLVLTRFEGVEGLSELFEYQIDALSKRPNLNFDSAIGEKCSVTFKIHNVREKRERHFSGVLAQAQWLGGGDAKTYAYRLWLRPSLWLLSQKAECRIFHSMTAPEIIKKLLEEHGIAFEDNFSENHPTREYCVQYRETDLAFLSRLMEEEGIYYFFKHSPGEHKLFLVDSMSKHEPIAGAEILPFIALAGQDRHEREHIYEWHSERRFRTAKVALDAYDQKKSSTDLYAEKETNPAYKKLEVFDYPGRYTEKADGEYYAKVRVEAAQAQDNRRQAAGDAISLYPGGLFTLEKHGTASENKQYLVVRASHSYTSPEHYRSGGGGGPDQVYFGNYDLLLNDSNKPFRAPFVTPKPLVHGPQTAKVVTEVGKESEEVEVDEHGRIKVQFHWERIGGKDSKEKYSRRVRVSQIWSGEGWGGQFIPRVGQEAVVIFLEGDPDEPLVVGTVYNDKHKHPYTGDCFKTQSGWKTQSTKDGKGRFNEFRFDDKKNAEQIYMRAERNHDVLVRNKETWEIGPAFEESPKGASSRVTTLVKGDDQLDIKKGNLKTTLDEGDETRQLKMGNRDTTLSMGNDKLQLKMGNLTVRCDLGKIEMEAMQSIELKVGQSSVKLDQMGVTIKGMMIKSEATMMSSTKGLMTEVKGDAMLTLKGGITMIN